VVREQLPAKWRPSGGRQAEKLIGMAADDDTPRQHAVSRTTTGAQGFEDPSKNLRFDSAKISECVPVFGFQTAKSCSFKHAVHGRGAL
jgi:hypothetical protein